MRHNYPLFAVYVSITSLLCHATFCSAGMIYASDVSTNALYTIDQTSASPPVLVGGLAPFDDVFGLAYDSTTDTLYGVSDSSGLQTLVTIDQMTGVATAVGAIDGLGTPFPRGLAFDDNTGTLYLSDIQTDSLYSVNTLTGNASLIGAIGFAQVEGLAFDPNSNTLYGSDVSPANDQLITINTATGAGTLVGAIGFGDVEGLAFDAFTNTLYGTAQIIGLDDLLITIDTATGAGTFLRSETPLTQVQGLAFVPEPTSLSLAGVLGIVGITIGVRRQRIKAKQRPCSL